MSLRVRLLLAVTAVAFVALLIADVATYSSLRSFLYARVDQSLTVAGNAMLRRGPPREDALAAVSSGAYVERRFPDGRAARFPGHRPSGEEFVPSLPESLDSTALARNFTSGEYRARVLQLPGGGQLIVALPLDDTRATLRRLVAVELFVTVGALGAALALGWWLVRKGLEPLSEVETTARAIAGGEMNRRVPGHDASTEVGQVALALNTMLDRIEAAFAQRDATEARLRRFVADASHELRTPVAAVGAYAELFERGASDRPDDLDRVMAGIRTETARMGDLVQDLLLLARLDEGRPLDRKPVELVGLAAEAVDAAAALGPEWPVRLEAADPVEVIGDRDRLRQVLDNLLSNVRAHTPPGTDTVVTVAANGSEALVTVKDTGPGLDDEQRSRVFERFYRADPSRSRQHGGSGLGLAIVSAIVGAHDGRVGVDSPDDGGTAFTVRLPQAAA